VDMARPLAEVLRSAVVIGLGTPGLPLAYTLPRAPSFILVIVTANAAAPNTCSHSRIRSRKINGHRGKEKGATVSAVNRQVTFAGRALR
jgi:hypothetical protein